MIVNKKIKLNLVGLDGNAFSLMGAFSRQARKEKWTLDEIKSVIDECQKSDYDHLLYTLMEHCEDEEDEEMDVCDDCLNEVSKVNRHGRCPECQSIADDEEED